MKNYLLLVSVLLLAACSSKNTSKVETTQKPLSTNAMAVSAVNVLDGQIISHTLMENITAIDPRISKIVMGGFTESPFNSGFVGISYDNKNSEADLHLYTLDISLSKKGAQAMYLYAVTDTCDPNYDTSVHDTAIKVNVQNISFYRYCTEGGYQAYTPKTEKGEQYLLDMLRTEEVIPFFINGTFVPFSAKNFNAAWDNFGGDAI